MKFRISSSFILFHNQLPIDGVIFFKISCKVIMTYMTLYKKFKAEFQ